MNIIESLAEFILTIMGLSGMAAPKMEFKK